MTSTLEVFCCICKQTFDGMRHYGRDAMCCSKQCWEEYEWRRTLAILGKPYRPMKEKPDDRS